MIIQTIIHTDVMNSIKMALHVIQRRNTKHWKHPSFPKELAENADLYNPFEQNGHTQIFHKMQFRSLFKKICLEFQSA